MRFFAHDGKITHGPATVGELLKLPGFDGETLVCPVGAANSEDWKPALAYPPFKRALLSPEPAAVLPPAPRIKTTPCPRCEHQNPEEAHYCNACGASLDAKREVLPPALETALPTAPMLAPEPARSPLEPKKTDQLTTEVPIPTEPYGKEMPPPNPLESGPPPHAVGTRPAWKRPALLAAFVLAAIVASGLAWRMLAPTPVPDSSKLTLLAPMPISAPAPIAPVPAEAVSPVQAPAATPTTELPFADGPKKSKRRSRTKPAPESKVEEIDPLLESLLANETRPATDGEKSKTLSMPGLDRPVSVADQTALAQVHEHFDFCAQLIKSGAYGDHYDTCLCKDAREAAPYRGRRDFYVSTLQKDASAGHLETSATIISSKLNKGAATVTSHWTSRLDDRGRDLTQTWRLEDGLWCRAP